jgi:SsrA-binding protein
MKKDINIVNKKAKHEYEFLQTYVCGVKLIGCEVKSIHLGKVSISEGYCYFNNNELFIKGMNISDYGYGTVHDNTSDRKLLLKRKELNKLEKELVKGLTIVPYRVFTNERGLIKIEISLSRGKKNYDKRNDLKSKDIDRDSKREISGRFTK